MNTINLKFMIEKKDGHGEDSDPLFLVKGDFCAVGVFDGMGGSGAGKGTQSDKMIEKYGLGHISTGDVHAVLNCCLSFEPFLNGFGPRTLSTTVVLSVALPTWLANMVSCL